MDGNTTFIYVLFNTTKNGYFARFSSVFPVHIWAKMSVIINSPNSFGYKFFHFQGSELIFAVIVFCSSLLCCVT